MTLFNLTSTEIVLLVVLAVVILGPRRLPGYASRLAQLVRQARAMAEGAKNQIREEMGPAFDDVDWRQLDPRQYDPRRIVREALADPAPKAVGASSSSSGAGAGAQGPVVNPHLRVHDPSRPTPYDVEAT